MADEKKPRIDLKARLGRASAPGGSLPYPGDPTGGLGGASRSNPPPLGRPSAPAPGVPVGPPPQFQSGGAPPIDPSNPLAAVAAPYRQQSVAVAAPAGPAFQRIEVDETAVQQARAGATKRGLVLTVIVAAAFAGVGYVAGGAAETNNAREKSKHDAGELATDLGKAKETLTSLADKMEAGRNTLVKERKFPDQLAKDLGGLNVAFDGTVLAGRRFSGISQDTTAALVDFITSVQAVNDRKELIQGLLGKLQKPLTEQLNAPPGQQTISYVAVISKDTANNPTALLAQLSTPIVFTPPQVALPAEFAFADPLSSGNSKLDRYKSGDVSSKPAALPVLPKTFEKVCPSETSGASAQLAAQIGGIIRDIRGEAPASADIVSDTKAGMLERADKLALALQKVK